MDERLKMAAFAFLAAACTAAVWHMQTGPRAASAASTVEPLPEDQRIALVVKNEVARQLPAAVETEVQRQLDIIARRAQEKKEQDDDLLKREAEKWAPAYRALSDLQLLRGQIELYRMQHKDAYPRLAGMKDWSVLMSHTDAAGGESRAGALGPYLSSAPMNLFNQKTSVAAAGSATAEAGWSYDEQTGTIKVVVPASELERAKPLNGDFEMGK